MKSIFTIVVSCVFICSSCVSAHNVKMYKPPEEKSADENIEENRLKYDKYKLTFDSPDSDILKVSPCFIQGNYEALKELNVHFPLPRRTSSFNELMPNSYLLIDELLIVDNSSYKMFKQGLKLEKASNAGFSMGMLGLSATVATPLLFVLAKIGSMIGEITNESRSNKVDSDPYVIGATVGASVFLSGLLIDFIFSGYANRKYKETSQIYNQYLKEYYGIE